MPLATPSFISLPKFLELRVREMTVSGKSAIGQVLYGHHPNTRPLTSPWGLPPPEKQSELLLSSQTWVFSGVSEVGSSVPQTAAVLPAPCLSPVPISLLPCCPLPSSHEQQPQSAPSPSPSPSTNTELSLGGWPKWRQLRKGSSLKWKFPVWDPTLPL